MSDIIIPTTPLPIVTVTRTHHRDDGTFGIMDIEGDPLYITVELPWKDNRENISCIPSGEYICKKEYSPKFLAPMFFIQNVPNRIGVICGHVANTINDLLGCIGIGMEFGKSNGKDAVLMSRVAFLDYMNRFKNCDQFKLVIKEC